MMPNIKSFDEYIKESNDELKAIIKQANSMGFDLSLLENSKAVIIRWIERTAKGKKGEGKKVIDLVKDYARSKKKEVWLDVDAASGDQQKLFQWYEKQGFKPTDYYEYDPDLMMWVLKDKYAPTKFYPMMVWK